jgi:IPT/TIG domain
MRKLVLIFTVGAMLVGSSHALAATGPLKTTCGEAWPQFGRPSKACAIVWWDETHEASAHCTLEYSFPGVTTNVSWCQLQQGKGKTFESVVAGVVPGDIDTSTTNQLYTLISSSVAPIMTDTYSVAFEFQPSTGNSEGPVVQLATPFIHVPPRVTAIFPTTGSIAGGTHVEVTGWGFALGSATTFKFGKELGTSVNCRSTTECTVIAPAHAAGKVDVKATVNKVTSPKNRPADQFSYS